MSASTVAAMIPRESIRVLIYYEFRHNSSEREAARRINQAIGEDTVSQPTVHRWYQRFRDGDVSFVDEPHTGRPPAIDLDAIQAAVEEDPRQSTRCLAERLQCSHSTIERSLHQLGKQWKFAVWIPHQLALHQLRIRSDICLSLLTYKRNMEWLSNLITGDEKWVLYVNYSHKRQWLKPSEQGVSTPKPAQGAKKALLCCWWNCRGVIHWELLPDNATVTAQVYCDQLDRVALKLRGKQDKVYLLHDNARPHVANVTQMKIRHLGWTLLPHPPYSPDIAPSDYHLFRSLAHHLEDHHFTDDDHLKTDIQKFFDRKSPGFYRIGIAQLPFRWQHIVDNNGAYYQD